MAPGERQHANSPGLLRGWASEPRPPNHRRRMRQLPLVCAGQDLPILVTVAASDPILLAVAPGSFALTSGERAARNIDGRFRLDCFVEIFALR